MPFSFSHFSRRGFDTLKSAANLVLNLLPSRAVIVAHSGRRLHTRERLKGLFVERWNLVVLVSELNVGPGGFHLSLPNGVIQPWREA